MIHHNLCSGYSEIKQHGMIMQDLGFNFIDSHIHQWDPLNTPHSARMAVKVLVGIRLYSTKLYARLNLKN